VRFLRLSFFIGLFFFPFLCSSVLAQEKITIISYNIWLNSHSPDHSQKVVEFILEQNADVVGLQEVECNTVDNPLGSGCFCTRDYILQKLQERDPNWQMRTSTRLGRRAGCKGRDGPNRKLFIALLTKHPIEDYQDHTLKIYDDRERSLDRVSVHGIKIRLPSGERVWVFNTHPKPGGQPACDVLPDYLNFVNQYSNEMRFLTGDFNLTDRGPCYPDLTSQFPNTCTVLGEQSCQDTIVSPDADYAIDFILHDDDFNGGQWKPEWIYTDKTVNERAINGVGAGVTISDHWPVVARFTNGSVMTPTPTVNPIPNCFNLSGQQTLVLGETGNYSANFFSAQGNLSGEIYVTSPFQERIIFSNISGTSGRLSGDWTPEAIGSYTVSCRAWNDAIAECRPAELVDGPPRYPCRGPNGQMTVNVLAPTVTPLPPFCLLCPSDRLAKSLGNANCDNGINLSDFSLWLSVYKKILNNQSVTDQEKAEVDFNCQEGDGQHTVNLADFNIWLSSYRQTLGSRYTF